MNEYMPCYRHNQDLYWYINQNLIYQYHSHPLNQPRKYIKWRNQSVVRLHRKNANLGLRVFATTSDSEKKLKGNGAVLPSQKFNIPVPFGGKSDSVSFSGLTHKVTEGLQLILSVVLFHGLAFTVGYWIAKIQPNCCIDMLK